MGDWMGARKVLMRIVIWWSVFTVATGWMFSLVGPASSMTTGLGEGAGTGVDYLAVGALTHSAPVLDIAMDLRPAETGPA